MSEKTVHNLSPAFDSIPYRMQNRTGSTNSLLDDSDYFLNSGDLAGIPVVGSDNEEEQTFAPKDGLSSALRSEDSRGDGRRVRDHVGDNEKDTQIQNMIQKDLSPPFDKGSSVFKSLRKDFSIARDDSKDTFLAKEKTREGSFQERDKRLEKMPKELDSRLKSSLLDKSGNIIHSVLLGELRNWFILHAQDNMDCSFSASMRLRPLWGFVFNKS